LLGTRTKNGAQRCLTSKIRAERLQKNTRRPFFGGYIKEVLVIIVGENLWAKVAEKLFGQAWGNSSKNPLHHPKIACSYTCAFVPSINRLSHAR